MIILDHSGISLLVNPFLMARLASKDRSSTAASTWKQVLADCWSLPILRQSGSADHLAKRNCKRGYIHLFEHLFGDVQKHAQADNEEKPWSILIVVVVVIVQKLRCASQFDEMTHEMSPAIFLLSTTTRHCYDLLSWIFFSITTLCIGTH